MVMIYSFKKFIVQSPIIITEPITFIHIYGIILQFIFRLDHREPQPAKISCLDIEEPIFVESLKAKKGNTQTGKEESMERNECEGMELK